MRTGSLRAALPIAILMALIPCVAHGQEENNCEVYYCSAYGFFSGGQVMGYVDYYDDSEDLYLSVSACVMDPNGSSRTCDSDGGWDYASASVELSADSNGTWEIAGFPYYYWDGNGSEPIADGDIYYDVGVMEEPTGEDNIQLTDVWVGVIFAVTVLPTFFDFDAYQAAESIGPADDQCFATYHATSQPVTASAAPPFYLTNNRYQDTISAPNSYYQAYRDATALSHSSCGWTVYQEMSYNGGSPYTCVTFHGPSSGIK